MTPAIIFDRVGKRYKLRHDRPTSLRELFVSRWPLRRAAASPATGDPATLWALRDVSFEIQSGETVGLIGPNGAGKSTALKLISRVIAPNEGQVHVRGRVAALLELGTGFHPDLSGRDNIFLSGALAGMGRDEMARKFDSIVDFSGLASFIDMPVKHYSSGMFARLAFAVSIHLEPEILLVDEVLAVGDQDFQNKCLERIGQLQRSGVGVCFVSHALDTVRSLCARAIWFDHGRIQLDGPAEPVVASYIDHILSGQGERLATPTAIDPKQRWGSRRVEITGVEITDGQGQERRIFETGDCLRVTIRYQANEAVPPPVFGVAIHRQDGFHVCGPNTDFSGFAVPALRQPGSISYTIPYLPLLDGLYLVTAAIHNRSDTEMYDYHDRVYPFRVANHSGRMREHFGLMTIRGEWALGAGE